jgi:Trk K+ transport system NAD-binding subunit
MAVIKDTKNEPLFHLLGVDLVVNSTHQVVTSLEEGVPGSPLVHLKNFRPPDLELVSITVPEDAGVVGKHLTELDLPQNSKITLVVRANRPYLPAQVTALEGDDEVVAVTVAGEEQSLYDTLTGV